MARGGVVLCTGVASGDVVTRGGDVPARASLASRRDAVARRKVAGLRGAATGLGAGSAATALNGRTPGGAGAPAISALECEAASGREAMANGTTNPTTNTARSAIAVGLIARRI
jgi:hypothetical protein